MACVEPSIPRANNNSIRTVKPQLRPHSASWFAWCLILCILVCVTSSFVFGENAASVASRIPASNVPKHQETAPSAPFMAARKAAREYYSSRADKFYASRLTRRADALAQQELTTAYDQSPSVISQLAKPFDKYNQVTTAHNLEDLQHEASFLEIQQTSEKIIAKQSLRRIAKAVTQQGAIVRVTDQNILSYLGAAERPFITLIMITAEKYYHQGCGPCHKFHEIMNTLSENIFQNQASFWNATSGATLDQLDQYLTYPQTPEEMLNPLNAGSKPFPIVIVQVDRDAAPQTLMATQIRAAPQLFILPPQFVPKKKETRAILYDIPASLRWSPVVANLNLDAVRNVLQDHFSTTQMTFASITDNSLALVLNAAPPLFIFAVAWSIAVGVMLFFWYQQPIIRFTGRYFKGTFVAVLVLIVIACLSGPSVHKGARRNMGPADQHDNILQIITRLIPRNLFNVKVWGADGRNAYFPETVAVVLIHVIFTSLTVLALESAFSIQNKQSLLHKIWINVTQANFFARGTRHIVARDVQDQVLIARSDYLLTQYQNNSQKPQQHQPQQQQQPETTSPPANKKQGSNRTQPIVHIENAQSYPVSFGTRLRDFVLVLIISLGAFAFCVGAYLALVGLYQRKFGNRTPGSDLPIVYKIARKFFTVIGLRSVFMGFFELFSKQWT